MTLMKRLQYEKKRKDRERRSMNKLIERHNKVIFNSQLSTVMKRQQQRRYK